MCVYLPMCVPIKRDNKRRNELEKRGTICYNKRFKTTFSCNVFLNTKQFDVTEETSSIYIAWGEETRKKSERNINVSEKKVLVNISELIRGERERERDRELVGIITTIYWEKGMVSGPFNLTICTDTVLSKSKYII